MGGDRNRLVSRLEDERGGRAELMRAAAAYLKSEPERLAAAHSEGRKEATAEIAKFVRERHLVVTIPFETCQWLADAIERQDHTLSRDGIGDG